MFARLKKAFKEKGRTIVISVCLLFSILTMGIVTLAWFTTVNPGTDHMNLSSNDNSVIVDAYAYKPGYTTDSNGDPVDTAHSNHDATTPLLQATKVAGSTGSASYTVTFSSAALSTFTYSSLYGDELYQNEKSFPHIYLEFRYTKAQLDGFVKASVTNIAYATDTTGYTNITSSLGYEYRTITEQNLTTGTKYRNGFTAAYADNAYTSSTWTTVAPSTTGFDIYNNTTDIAGYSYGSSYTVQKQCFVPNYPYKYDTTNYYYSKSTFLEYRVNPISWINYFRNNSTAHAGLYSFGVTFNVALQFSDTPFYDSSSATQPRISLNKSLLSMQFSSTDQTVSISAYNFTGTPTYALASGNEAIVTGTVSGTALHLTSYTSSGSATITITATSGNQSAQAMVTVRVSGPTLTLSTSSLSVKMGASGSITADAYNFANTVTISAVSSSTSVATVSVSGSTITISPVAIGDTTVTVTATDGTTTKTATCAITITAGDKTLSSIAVTTQPDTTTYNVGDTLDTTGLVITATWSDGSTSNVTTSCSFSPTTFDTTGNITVTASYGGKTTTFTVTVNGSLSTTTYTLITSTADLVAGAQYVIATSATAGSAVAMSTTQNGNNRGQTDVTISSELKITAASNIEQVTLGGSTGAWTLQTMSGGYLDATSSDKNYLRTVSTLTVDSYWTIAFSSGAAVITDTGKSTRNIMRYNSTSTLFSCYTSGQNPIYLYKQDAEALTLNSIDVTTMPTTTTYTVGQTFNTSGMVVSASWSDGSTTTPTNYTTSPTNGATLLTAGTQTVTVSLGGKTDTFTITVNPRVLTSIAVTTAPTKTTYALGEAFASAGMVVTATYDNSTTAAVTTYTTDAPTVFTTSGSKTITVTYTESSVTKTATTTVTVTNMSLTLSSTTLTINGAATNASITATASGYYQSVTYTAALASANSYCTVSITNTNHLNVVTTAPSTTQTVTAIVTATDAGGNTATANVAITINPAGQTTGTAIYTISSVSAVTTTGTTPSGSAVAYDSTYSSVHQLTSGNSMTWTITSLTNVTITSMTFSMKSNSSAGAGGISYTTANNATPVYLVANSTKFNASTFYGSWSQTYVNVSFTSLSIAPGSSIAITINATTNSLYCQSLTMGWTQGA